MAMTWKVGPSALGSAWRKMTRRSDSPLRRAISTYSLSSTSIIDARMILAT